MGGSFQVMLVADTDTAMMEQLGLAGTAFRELFGGEGVFGGTASVRLEHRHAPARRA